MILIAVGSQKFPFDRLIKEIDRLVETGVITNAVKAGKKVIGVPRRAEYGEHVDNHQEQLINEFVEQNLIWGCTDIKKLESCIKTSKENKKEPYHSNTETYIKEIDSILKKMIK